MRACVVGGGQGARDAAAAAGRPCPGSKRLFLLLPLLLIAATHPIPRRAGQGPEPAPARARVAARHDPLIDVVHDVCAQAAQVYAPAL